MMPDADVIADDKRRIQEKIAGKGLSVDYCEFDLARFGMRCYVVVSKNAADQVLPARVVIDDDAPVQLCGGVLIYPDGWLNQQDISEVVLMLRTALKLQIAVQKGEIRWGQ